jgi:predicted HicB family RNase H-like nuclease
MPLNTDPNRGPGGLPYPHDLEGDIRRAYLNNGTIPTNPASRVVRRQFTRLEDLTAFEKSTEFEQIQKWLVKLREQKNATDTESEPTRVITVRLPKSMHEYLRTEAHDLRTSMNKLCISKLLQVIEQDLIPTERTSAPPRTKPAPQPVASSSPSNFGGTSQSGTTSHFGNSQPTFRSASGF